ncbi:MAG: DNA-directed RNA polymerase subunit beta [Anaeroplasmataceae bacterium]|nr:DNA-directed RNA polymerase subunit beta [Anaeroplasmataceae bacterium]MDE5868520.1 DNA-directed RNA polymerase subunit beta [Anaeroplasmataceae bacterium]
MNYRNVNYGKKSVRRNYSKIRTEVELPDLIEIQTKSFDWFVTTGLEELFKDISPITSFNGDLKLSFGDFHFDDSKFSIVDCKLRDINYARPLKVNVRLENAQTGEVLEQELFMGDIPYMTPVGTFIINGAERVIISQIVRSSGVYYAKEIDKKTGDTKFTGTVIPTRGAWIEYEMGSKNVWYGKLDRSKKIPLTTVLRAYGLSTNKQITDLFGDSEYMQATFEKDTTTNSEEAAIEVYSKLRQGEKVPVEGARALIIQRLFDDRRYDLQKVGRFKYNMKLDVLQRAKGLKLAQNVTATEDIFNDETGELVFAKGTRIASIGDEISGEVLEKLKLGRAAYRQKIDLGNTLCDDPYNEILMVTVEKHDMSENVKIIGNDQREKCLHITMSDIIATASYYLNLYQNVGTLDDIDHLGNRRLRLIGELLKNQFRIGFAKLEKNIIDRMSTVEINEATPQNLINIKPLTSSLKEFFGSSQLSQFMDQINPLAEITQKRRISALGTGGIARDRAGVEVRDVHNSHYGRMCPIETPEGPSIGLITSLATYAKVNEYGFIETLYFVVKKDKNGKKYVSEEMVYLSADKEDGYVIASASTKLDAEGHIIEDKVIGRRNGETEMVDPDEVDFMDVSPKQIVSVAAACVPFLEHDDATRALMGANMQRQAVPIINPESPIVGTGMEYKAAKDSGSALIATMPGIVQYVDAKKIIIKEDGGDMHRYDLYQFLRSNSATAIMQRPIVKVGERVDRGDIIADGQSMKDGELALGRNVRIAFMTWEGYNFEDAVIMSEKMVYDDVYTSIHIDEFSVECRDTKLGKEEFTYEIPNVKDETKKNLDERGIVIPGTEVKEGDILVGKITPKGVTDPTPEERLLLAIFGEKSRDVRDTSLRVPHGGGGVVQSIQHFSKAKGDDLAPGVNEVVRIYIVQKRKIQVGDKMAGRHGNKGVISNILPLEDMPFTADGQPIDIMLNPQGVPSRMNIGQVLELHLGIAAKKLGIKVATPVFDGATIEDIEAIMKEANLPYDGKEVLYDGRTGEPFENKITVGIMYFVKLSHMVDDKLHARNVGPYTLVTQQPMGGKAQNGGQRFGEMEVWALEAYGAANTLREMLTVKSDDLIGRDRVFDAIVDGKPIPESSIPESFRVLTRELQALGIHVELMNDKDENEVNRSIVDMKIRQTVR